MASGIYLCIRNTPRYWNGSFLICESTLDSQAPSFFHRTLWILCQGLCECAPCLFISCCFLKAACFLSASCICSGLNESSFQKALASVWAMGVLCVSPLCDTEVEVCLKLFHPCSYATRFLCEPLPNYSAFVGMFFPYLKCYNPYFLMTFLCAPQWHPVFFYREWLCISFVVWYFMCVYLYIHVPLHVCMYVYVRVPVDMYM